MMGVHGEILDRLRRAARNQTRLHLDYEHVVALLDLDFYDVLTRKDAMELAGACKTDENPTPNPGGTNSANSGSGTAPTGTTGTSVGSTVVQDAANQLASEAARQIIRQSKLKKNSQSISSKARNQNRRRNPRPLSSSPTLRGAG